MTNKNDKHELRSFYHPHDPELTAFENLLVNPWTGEVTVPPSMTKQEFLAECDINGILAEFKITGQIRHISANAERGQYLDLSGAPDYQEALNIVARGNEAFASLPSQVRNRFNNDPAEFLAFMENPDNQDEIIRLGLATDNRPPAPGAIIEPGTPAGGPAAPPQGAGGLPPADAPPKAGNGS